MDRGGKHRAMDQNDLELFEQIASSKKSNVHTQQVRSGS